MGCTFKVGTQHCKFTELMSSRPKRTSAPTDFRSLAGCKMSGSTKSRTSRISKKSGESKEKEKTKDMDQELYHLNDEIQNDPSQKYST